MSVFDYFSEQVAVDAGTDSLRIIWKEKIVFDEPSQLGLDSTNTQNVKIAGIGKESNASSTVVIIKPVNYVISDFHAFEMLLRGALKRTVWSKSFFPMSLISLFSIPTNVTEAEKRTYRDSAEHANCKEVYLIHQCCSIAIGLNILFEKKNFVLIDFSASKFQISIFINGLLASVGMVKIGTLKIIQILKNYLLRSHQINVNASEILDILNDFPRHQNAGQVRIQNVSVETRNLHEVMKGYFQFVNDEVQTTLDNLKSDPGLKKALSNGVYFSGGGSLTDYFRQQISLPEGVPVHVSKTPLHDSVNGLLKVMIDKNKYKEYLMT
ncbi:rod shape-determining protein [soil metagenome]